LRRLQGKIVAVALPRRRHDDDAIRSGGIHLAQEFILADRNVAVRFQPRGPRPLRRIGAPDMDLRVDDPHDDSCGLDMLRRDSRTAARAPNTLRAAACRVRPPGFHRRLVTKTQIVTPPRRNPGYARRVRKTSPRTEKQRLDQSSTLGETQ
jgi:hypothetical protein